jgi:hypothetical protein
VLYVDERLAHHEGHDAEEQERQPLAGDQVLDRIVLPDLAVEAEEHDEAGDAGGCGEHQGPDEGLAVAVEERQGDARDGHRYDGEQDGPVELVGEQADLHHLLITTMTSASTAAATMHRMMVMLRGV